MAKYEAEAKQNPFGFGILNTRSNQYFSGNSFLQGLVPAGDDIDVNVAQVTFEPGVRNNWHKHLDGYQIILVTAGEGWGQIEGQPARSLKPGDVMVFHDGVKHWHGAKAGSYFAHLAITKGHAQWLEPVTDDDYNNLEK